MNTEEFEDRLKALRPRLHRYCARMTGSAINGEDVLQDTVLQQLGFALPRDTKHIHVVGTLPGADTKRGEEGEGARAAQD